MHAMATLVERKTRLVKPLEIAPVAPRPPPLEGQMIFVHGWRYRHAAIRLSVVPYWGGGVHPYNNASGTLRCV
jgi:hypothetical protein